MDKYLRLECVIKKAIFLVIADITAYRLKGDGKVLAQIWTLKSPYECEKWVVISCIKILNNLYTVTKMSMKVKEFYKILKSNL